MMANQTAERRKLVEIVNRLGRQYAHGVDASDRSIRVCRGCGRGLGCRRGHARRCERCGGDLTELRRARLEHLHALADKALAWKEKNQEVNRGTTRSAVG